MRSDALRATAGLTAALLLLALAATPAPAGAASYTVWSCRGPDGAPISTQAWQAGDESRATQDTCAEGGALRAHLLASDNEPGLVRGFRFGLPPGATVVGYRVHMYAATAEGLLEDARLGGGSLQAGIDDDAGLTVGEFDAGCQSSGCTFGAPEPALGEKNLASASEIDSQGLVVGVRCGWFLGCYAQEGDKTLAEVRMFRSQIDLRDDLAPGLGAPYGSLVSGQSVSGQAAVTFGATDEGGGVAATAVLVDGAQVARHSAGGACKEPYVGARPCPGQVNSTLTIDVSSLAPGQHTASLWAIDAAGNIAVGDPIPFSVAEPPPPAPPTQPSQTIVERIVQVPVPVSPQPVTIDAERERVALPDRGSGVKGLVKDSAGRPVTGAKLIVRSRPFGVRRVKLRIERTLTTDAAGRFAMPAGAASRLLVLDVDDAAHRAVEQAEIELMRRLRVEASTRDRTLRNGSVVTLRAAIEGAGGGSSGKVVLVQAVVGGRWATVESLTADADGDAVWRYRFRGTTRRANYRFRVRVERAGDVWPWPTTNSQVLRMEVSP